MSGNVETELISTTPDDLCVVSPVVGYERWAPTYDSAPNPLLAREERHLLPLLIDLRGKHVLDLACGTGRWLDRLMKQDAESGVGADLSPAMLRVAKTKDRVCGRLVRASCEALPFASSYFDLGLCSFALGHIRDLKAAVSELARVMKPGADLFASDLHPESLARGWRVGFRDKSAAVQIEVIPHTPNQILHAFSVNEFECLTADSLCLEAAEKPIFERAGKSSFFAEACRFSAIMVWHFRRRDREDDRRSSDQQSRRQFERALS